MTSNLYDLLGVAPSASTEEIKKAFRREMARYHPDKVHHLAPEFQALAATRATELGAAYAVLLDEGQRTAYDRNLRLAEVQGDAKAPPPAPHPAPAPPSPSTKGSNGSARSNRSPDGFLKKVALERLREAVHEELGAVEEIAARGFDVAVATRGKRTLFRKSVPPMKVLGRVVARVDAESVQEVWPVASRIADQPDGPACVFLMADGIAPARELADAIAAQRRRQPKASASLVLVPVDLRNWHALMPADAPPEARAIAQRLRDAG